MHLKGTDVQRMRKTGPPYTGLKECEYQAGNINKQERKRGKTIRRENKKSRTGQIKMAYNNVKGKMGKNYKKVAEEIKEMADKESWCQDTRIEGFNTLHRERMFDQKKGGGLMVFARENIKVVDW